MKRLALALAVVLGLGIPSVASGGSPSGAPVASTAAACAQWDVSGTWATHQNNGYDPTFSFSQSGTQLSGSATLPGAEADRAGYTGDTGTVSGSISGDRLDVTVTWPPKRDGSTSAGLYTASVVPGSTAGQGDLSGGYAGGSTWTGAGPAKCVSAGTGPPAPTVVPPPSTWDVASAAFPVIPGGAVGGSSPPLGNADKATAIERYLSSASAMKADLVVLTGKKLRHACYVDFVANLLAPRVKTYKTLNGAETAYQPGVDIPAVLSNLTLCLAIAEAAQAAYAQFIGATATVPNAGATATSAGCGPGFRFILNRHVGKTKVKGLHRGAAKLHIRCRHFSRGIAVTYSTGSRTPLRKLVGPRLLFGVAFSRRDSSGGQVTFTYHRG
jgi:hypothetical protein